MSNIIYPGKELAAYLEDQKISKTDAAERIGVSRQQLYVYFDSAHLSKKIVDKVVNKLGVNISDIWRTPKFTSNGHMVAEDRLSEYQKRGVNDFVPLRSGMYLMITPLVEEYAAAGFLTDYASQDFLEDLPNHSIVVDRFHRGNYYSFRVHGDSMDDGSSDSIVSGSIVTAREIKKELWNSKFHIHKFHDYVIVHENGILVKRISEHDVEQGLITCSSLNKDKDSYPDFQIGLDHCNMILNIVNVSVSR